MNDKMLRDEDIIGLKIFVWIFPPQNRSLVNFSAPSFSVRTVHVMINGTCSDLSGQLRANQTGVWAAGDCSSLRASFQNKENIILNNKVQRDLRRAVVILAAKLMLSTFHVASRSDAQKCAWQYFLSPQLMATEPWQVDYTCSNSMKDIRGKVVADRCFTGRRRFYSAHRRKNM